jgi:hypothetical protein
LRFHFRHKQLPRWFRSLTSIGVVRSLCFAMIRLAARPACGHSSCWLGAYCRAIQQASSRHVYLRRCGSLRPAASKRDRAPRGDVDHCGEPACKAGYPSIERGLHAQPSAIEHVCVNHRRTDIAMNRPTFKRRSEIMITCPFPKLTSCL